MRGVGALFLASLLASLLAAGCTGRPAAPDEAELAQRPAADQTLQSGPMLQEFSIGGDFVLTDHRGQRFDLAQQRGRVFLLFFGYTSCPDFCPNTLARLAQAYDLLGDAGTQVTTLLVTVDPAHDTPERLGSYLRLFAIPALGLTGDRADLQLLATRYAARFEAEDGESVAAPLLAHTTYVYLIDGAGKVRYTFLYSDTARFIAAGITQLLQGPLDGGPGGI